MEREIAFTLAGEIRKRIHQDGKDANLTDIGQYTPAYIRTRVKKYNRSSAPRVIASLTRQMENDMTSGAIKTGKGYGIGFKNDFNFKKARWVEDTYDKKIFSLTQSEKEKVKIIAEDFIHRSIQRI